MPKCAVKRCRNSSANMRKKDGVTYHRFPVNDIIREKWRRFVAKERFEKYYKPNKSSVICSKHFLESDIYYTTKGFRRLKKIAVPHNELADDNEVSATKEGSLEESDSSEEVNELHVFESSAIKQEPSSPSHVVFISPAVDESLSSTSVSDSLLTTLKTSYYKKELEKCHQRLSLKDKQIRNLKKQCKRLIQANSSLKEIIRDLKTKTINV